MSHKKYGNCRIPAIIDNLKKQIIIHNTITVNKSAIMKAFLRLCSLKNTVVQYKFRNNCIKNTVIAIYFKKDFSTIRIIINDIPISRNKVDQTYLKTHLGGCMSGFFKLLKKLSSYE